MHSSNSIKTRSDFALPQLAILPFHEISNAIGSFFKWILIFAFWFVDHIAFTQLLTLISWAREHAPCKLNAFKYSSERSSASDDAHKYHADFRLKTSIYFIKRNLTAVTVAAHNQHKCWIIEGCGATKSAQMCMVIGRNASQKAPYHCEQMRSAKLIGHIRRVSANAAACIIPMHRLLSYGRRKNNSSLISQQISSQHFFGRHCLICAL